MSLTDLPLETFEHIIHYIDDAKDLLYFALVNKQFAKLIIQPHLQFRRIRCLTNTRFIWTKLADRPDFCARIRELHLYGRSDFHLVMRSAYPRNAILPASFLHNFNDSDIKVLWPGTAGITGWGTSMEENLAPSVAGHSASSQFQSSVEICSVEQSLTYLNNMLRLVANLTKVSLIFSVNANPTSQTLKAVFDNLMHHSCRLREIAVTWDPCGVQPPPDTFSSLWTFSDFTLFHFKVLYPALGTHDVDELLQLLVDRCPNLETLRLNFRTSRNPTFLDYLWKRGAWKHLHHLYLGQYVTLMGTQDGNLFRHFMARHPGIESLEYLGHDHFSRLLPLLKANAFKKLRALNLPNIPTELNSTPSSNSEIAPALQVDILEKMECLRLGRSTSTLLEKFYVPSLRILIIGKYLSNFEEVLGHYLPAPLERLCIGYPIRRVAPMLLEALSHLQKLTHLCISVGFGRPLPPPEIILPGVSKLSSLKYFGLSCKGARAESWVRLIRDASGGYAGYEIDTSVDSIFKWGDFSYI